MKKATTLRKFKFSDIGLASKVRGNMLAQLKSFDINQNLLFDENQIKSALMTILKQDQNQVHYVVKNVFRYDKDGDNAITYAQFTNFSVQQHFGQMAIQRLHRKGYYTNGARRLMNLEEFQTTLNYCLDFINSKGTHIQYERLFNEVDLDRDGMISYQDYFIFLREYFGSQSQAYEIQKQKPVPRPQPPQPKPQPQKPVNFIDGNGQTPQERFAKLIYSQFKITVMERDRNKNLLLEREQFEDILKNIFKLNYNEQIQLEQKFIGGSNTSKYQDFMRAVISSYMSQISAERFFQSDSISEDQFVNTVTNKVCQFVSVKPAEHILRACFKSGSNGRSSISTGDYVKIMRNIFQNFRFDTRGLPSVRPKSERFQSIAPKSYY